ncbi:MAG: sulfotransferase [Cucumibacter sp.]
MPDADYGAGARLLHRLALGGAVLPELTFDLEKSLYLKDCPVAGAGRHVFVCGLARAGSTLLMRALHATGEFASLTYRDMPFVLAPNLWRRVAGRFEKPGEPAERAHGDGVMADFDSPEGLEEVFWRMKYGRAYIDPAGLSPTPPSEADLAQFRAYVGLVLRRYGKARYLSKNNNNVLRWGSLAGVFPGAAVIVPFRHPFGQAKSLFEQHRRFRAMQEKDRFVRDYMGWLAHHEFGLDHRPFLWPGRPAGGAPPEAPDYWLAEWIATYEALVAQGEAGMPIFFSYDRFCADPEARWADLAARIGLPAGTRLAVEVRPARGAVIGAFKDSALIERALAVFDRLKRRA